MRTNRADLSERVWQDVWKASLRRSRDERMFSSYGDVWVLLTRGSCWEGDRSHERLSPISYYLSKRMWKEGNVCMDYTVENISFERDISWCCQMRYSLSLVVLYDIFHYIFLYILSWNDIPIFLIQQIPREDLEDHIRNECPHGEIKCPFRRMGCFFMVIIWNCLVSFRMHMGIWILS